jgi:hypothetical protein
MMKRDIRQLKLALAELNKPRPVKPRYRYRFEMEIFHELDAGELEKLEAALAAQLEDISLCWKSKLVKE